MDEETTKGVDETVEESTVEEATEEVVAPETE